MYKSQVAIIINYTITVNKVITNITIKTSIIDHLHNTSRRTSLFTFE